MTTTAKPVAVVIGATSERQAAELPGWDGF